MFTLSSLATIVIVLAILGFVLWLIQTKIPMDPVFRNIIYAVVVLALVLWILSALGIHVGSIN